jgi:type IV pilus assembly protein PilC
MLNRKAALASFSRQLALLSDSGVSIVRSLEITANAVGNEVYRLRLLEVKADVERGISIHKSIAGDKLFPDLVVSMIAVGEQTAQLGAVTQKIAVFYDEEVETYVKNLSTIMEPVIIVVIGVMVGGLVAAIMQPIMDLTDVAALA